MQFVAVKYVEVVGYFQAIVDAETAEEAQAKAKADDIVGDWILEGWAKPSSRREGRYVPLEDIAPLTEANDPRLTLRRAR